jgi:DNA-binding CsgD family transcriptional regulator
LPEAWHGFRPERLATILETLIDSGVPDSGLASGFLTFVRGDDTDRFEQHSADTATDAEMPDVMKLAQAIDLRMRGSVTEALDLLDSIGAVGPLQPVFDARGGWDLMITVQHGITAILAGRFDRAMAILTGARFQAPFESLVCLSRDALVKTALLQAAFGDQREARIALDHASALPRSISWIEPRIDVTAALAEAMLDSTTPQVALETVHSLPLVDVGEMWPFYAIALHRAHVRAGRVQELTSRIALLEGVPFPYLPGKGFAGSVLPLVRAVRAMEQNDLRSAAWFASAADPDFIGTRLVLLRLDARGNRVRRVPRTATRLAELPGVGALRRFELWRSSSLVEALLALGRDDEAVLVLRSSVGLLGDLLESEQELFSVANDRFGTLQPSSVVPRNQADVLGLVDRTESAVDTPTSTYLTPREREVVDLLATDLSRAEIAATLFISINTLKKHLRIVYDKLDVTRRDAAVLRAKHEGWITTPMPAPSSATRSGPLTEPRSRADVSRGDNPFGYSRAQFPR